MPVVWSHDASLRQICQRWVMICLPCTLGAERPNTFRIANMRCTENALRICRTSKTLPNKCTGPVLPINVHTVPHPMMHVVTASRRWTCRARVLHCLRVSPRSSGGWQPRSACQGALHDCWPCKTTEESFSAMRSSMLVDRAWQTSLVRCSPALSLPCLQRTTNNPRWHNTLAFRDPYFEVPRCSCWKT